MKKNKAPLGLILSGLLVWVAGSADAVTITYDASNRPTSITGLVVAGEATPFDVAITWGASFDSIYGTGTPSPPSPYFFGDQPGGENATIAIINALVADGDRAPDINQNSIGIPLRMSDNGFPQSYYASYDVRFPSQQPGWGGPSFGNFGARTVAFANQAWTVFTPANVPEGGSTLAMLGLAVAGIVRLRRKTA